MVGGGELQCRAEAGTGTSAMQAAAQAARNEGSEVTSHLLGMDDECPRQAPHLHEKVWWVWLFCSSFIGFPSATG